MARAKGNGNGRLDEAMTALSAARLKRMADELELKLGDEDLTRLRPMVADLLAVGRRLRLMIERERPTPRSR